MSWLLIILLAAVFVLFALSCIVIIAWIATGSPGISAANVLDLNPQTGGAGTSSLSNDSIVETLVHTGPQAAKEEEKEEVENGLVQTLYVDGKATVTRRTKFSDPSVTSDGPMEIHKPASQHEIIQWYDQIHPEKNNEPKNVDLMEMIVEENRGKLFRPEKDPPAEIKPSSRAEEYVALRKEYLLPALAAEAKRREDAAVKSRDASRFYMIVRGRDSCASRSSLTVPVQLFFPVDLIASPAAMNGRLGRWVIHHIVSRGETSNSDQIYAPDQKFLWQSDPIDFYDLAVDRDRQEVDTPLPCSEVQSHLLRLKLVDAVSGESLCSAFLNPSSMISNGPTCLGADLQIAWHAYRQIQHQPT